MSIASLKVNGRVHKIDVDPKCPLLYVLRGNLELNNPRFGCGVGQCGACTVLVDNHAVRSCQLTVASAVGKEIVTLEGLENAGKPHPVQARPGSDIRSLHFAAASGGMTVQTPSHYASLDLIVPELENENTGAGSSQRPAGW